MSVVEKATRLINQTSENVINRIENILERWNNERRKLNSCLNEIKLWKEFLPCQWYDSLEKKLSDFNNEELIAKNQLSDLLVSIRDMTGEQTKIIEIIRDIDERFRPSQFTDHFFREYKRTQKKIEILKRISPDKKELLTNISSIQDFIQDFYNDELYFLHICEQWQNEENFFKQIRYFLDLQKFEQNTKNRQAKFWVIDHDLHIDLKDKPNTPVIYHATGGSIISKDFYRYSLVTLTRKQIERLLNEYPSLTEHDLVDRHQQFIKDCPDGEMSKDGFIKEFEKRFPKENVRNFCEFAFSSIDQYKYGKINFSQFISAVIFTQPSDTHTRLHLVFSISDYNHSGTINTRKMVKFSEVITELYKGSNAVDTRRAKSTAERIMNMCQKDADDIVTEEEFIDCCQRSLKVIIVFLPNIEFFDSKWRQDGRTIVGGNGQGKQLNQLYLPFSIFVHKDQTIYIPDWHNHRIMSWQCNAIDGEIIGDLNENHLNYPMDLIVNKETNSFIISDINNRRVVEWSYHNNTIDFEVLIENIDCWGLAIDKNESLYVSDYKKNEVSRWDKGEQDGKVVAGGNGRGENLNQLNYPTYIFVDEDCSLYITDVENHRVIKWFVNAKEGVIVAGGNGNGNSLAQLSYPQGVIVDEISQVYVADSNNHRVMRWCNEAEEGTIVVGGNGKGQDSNQFVVPSGLAFDEEENLYVVDRFNNRIQKFEKN